MKKHTHWLTSYINFGCIKYLKAFSCACWLKMCNIYLIRRHMHCYLCISLHDFWPTCNLLGCKTAQTYFYGCKRVGLKALAPVRKLHWNKICAIVIRRMLSKHCLLNTFYFIYNKYIRRTYSRDTRATWSRNQIYFEGSASFKGVFYMILMFIQKAFTLSAYGSLSQ